MNPMTDKPTEEIERRAEKYSKSTLTQATFDECKDIDDVTAKVQAIEKAAFLAGHSAAKEEVEILLTAHRENAEILDLRYDKIVALEAENAELKKSSPSGRLALEIGRLKDELVALKKSNSELVEALGDLVGCLIEANGIKLDEKTSDSLVRADQFLARIRKPADD